MSALKGMILGLALLAGPGPLRAEAEKMATVYEARPVGKVTHAKGGVEDLRLGQPLVLDDHLGVQPSGRAGLVLVDGSIVRVEGGSELNLGKPAKGEGTLLGLLKGLVRVVAEKQNGRQLLLQTSNAVVAVKGTQYQVEAGEAQTELKVLEGKVRLTNPKGGDVSVGAGQAVLSYPDRVDAVRKLNFEEVKALRGAFKELVEKKKQEYAQRVREAKGKRTPKANGGKP